MTTIGRRTALLLACAGIAAIGRAQEPPAQKDTLAPGAWALQFGIGGNFTLTSFQGTLLGIQYRYAESNAVRVSVSFQGSYQDGTGLNGNTSSDAGTSSQSNDTGGKTTQVSFVIQNVWYAASHRTVYLYVAAGPELTYGRTAWNNSSVNPSYYSFQQWTSWSTTTTAYEETDWGVGARGALGVEWRATTWLAIHAEYSLEVRYRWQTSKNTADSATGGPGNYAYSSHSVQSSSGHNWDINSPYVLMGVSIAL